MTDLVTTIEPPSASADGSRNSFTLFCEFTSQSMNYAACLWRQGVLAKPDIKTPADWYPCTQARNCNRCTALGMGREEEIAGKAIYFVDRKVPPASPVRWGTARAPTHTSKPTTAVSAPSTKHRAAPDSMLDAMSCAGDLAAAISTPDKTLPSPPPPIKVSAPIVSSQAGESPLQMARRMAAARAAA